jgi:F-type H+-transporting ATPase subunit delta
VALSGSTARRYAEAILSFAADDRAVRDFRVSLDRVAAAFDRPTVRVLTDPATPLARRQAAVAAAAKDEPVEVRSVLRLLIERGDIGLVPLIARAFGDLVDRREGIEKARITTAVALEEEEREDLVRRLEDRSGRKLRATFAVDPAIVGGAKVQLGDHLIDVSLDARLRALGRQLASGGG